MKYTLPLILVVCLGLIISCSKDEFNTSPDVRIEFSSDTLKFDTVFVSAGSVTKTLKIFNPNNEKISISSIELAGGLQSAFKLNVDGSSGPSASNKEILANDSLYVFVTVNINPNAAAAPFLVHDSVRINLNGRTRQVQLQAFGQNARYLSSTVLTADTQWDNALPYVILGGLLVDTGVTLTINPGTRVYLHADAPLIVDGTLITKGTKQDSISFLGDRLDNEYKDLPAGWPGIYFRGSSINNSLEYTNIKNAYRGLVVDQPSPGLPKLDLRQCTIDNIYDAGLMGINTSINAVNCQISNCGINILVTNGGVYNFSHCTVASYNSLFIQHKKPVIVLSNWDSITFLKTYDLQANLINNIFWGESGTVENEVLVSKRGNNPFNILMENNLYKAQTPPPNTLLVGNLLNTPPLFDSINEIDRYYDFRINKYPSPAINAGKNIGVTIDRDGNPRDAQPDIGSYEKQ